MVHAEDAGVPSRAASQEVVVLVTRDEFAPTFEQDHFTADDVPENTAEGVRVFALRARDQDLKVNLMACRCSLCHRMTSTSS